MTIVYKEGGNVYLGQQPDQKLSHWIQKGQQEGQKYMYKGYRYFSNQKEQVVCYTTEKWDGCEIERRTRNGFKGIKTYIL